ncbi:hypothetical protein F511_34870, partial [Dorcoceras hygrometricum]
DQLLFSFLLASMSESAQSQMISCHTSSQLWTRVSQLFMKGYIDILAVCGHSIPEDDQILYVLGGIGVKYDSVVVHVMSRVDTLNLSEVGDLILAHEGRIEAYNTTGDSTTPIVNVTTVHSQRKES